jgi:outer membrane protein OmpA-like peptidoglycan-associated protein
MPKMGTPNVQAPNVQAPNVQTPQPTMPKVEAPNMQAPNMQAPNAQAPQPGMPNAQAPNMNAPSAGPVTLPEGKVLDVAPDSPTAEMARTLGDTSKPLPQSFQLTDLNFESGSATPTSVKPVDDLAAMLQAYPSARIRVAGHTDAMGDPAANRALSAARANSIKDMLVARGIAADRIQVVGEGQAAPIAPNENEQGRAENRRTEIELLDR